MFQFFLSALSITFNFAIASEIKAPSVTLIPCSYSYMGMPFADLEIEQDGNGEVLNYVRMTSYGTERLESLTLQAPNEEEWLHGWITKEVPSNTVEIVIYKESQADGNSKLINNNVPVGKEIWGSCQLP